MLAVGNLVGGRLSQRIAANVVLPWALVIAAASVVLLSQCYAPLLRWAAKQPMVLGELAAAVMLQAVPLVMLGILTPVILHDGDHVAGPWAGAVLAAGSGGGIAGALGAGLLLLPSLGLTRSLLLLATLLAATAIPAVWTGRRWTAAVVLLLTLLYASGASPAAATLPRRVALWAVGGPRYGYRAGAVGGWPAPDGLAHGTSARRGPAVRLPARTGAEDAAYDKNRAGRGPGGGLAPRLLAAHGVACRSVEVDPAVIEIARREFAFAGDVTPGDGRAVLARQDRRYDLIFLDVCTADRLPWHLFTFEAMQFIRRRLSPGGILAIQFIGDDGPWSASLVRTVRGRVWRGPQRDGGPADSPRSGRLAVALRGRGRAAAIAGRRCSARPAGTLAADRAGCRRRTADRRPLSGRTCRARAARQWRDICRSRWSDVFAAAPREARARQRTAATGAVDCG